MHKRLISTICVILVATLFAGCGGPPKWAEYKVSESHWVATGGDVQVEIVFLPTWSDPKDKFFAPLVHQRGKTFSSSMTSPDNARWSAASVMEFAWTDNTKGKGTAVIKVIDKDKMSLDITIKEAGKPVPQAPNAAIKLVGLDPAVSGHWELKRQ